jgi:hypothetical protein
VGEVDGADAEQQVGWQVFALDDAQENLCSAPGIAGLDHIGVHEAGDRAHGGIVFGGDFLNFHRGSSPIGGEAAWLDGEGEIANAERSSFSGQNAGEAIDCELSRLIGPEAGGIADAATDGGELHDGTRTLSF